MENAALQSFTINAAYVPSPSARGELRCLGSRTCAASLQSFTLSVSEKCQQWQQWLQLRDILGGGRWRGWWWQIDGEDDEVHARQVSCLTPKMTACM